jgi:hypothetical protein
MPLASPGVFHRGNQICGQEDDGDHHADYQGSH